MSLPVFLLFSQQFLAHSQCSISVLKEGNREDSRRGTEQVQMELGTVEEKQGHDGRATWS